MKHVGMTRGNVLYISSDLRITLYYIFIENDLIIKVVYNQRDSDRVCTPGMQVLNTHSM